MSAALEEVRVRTLGKSGWLTEKLKELGKLAADRAQGSRARASIASREEIQARIETKRAELEQAHVAAKLAKERIDVTLPGRGEARGGLHPVTKVRLRIEQLFRQAGFDVATGPEIEDDFHNFEALNIPADHPARAMHDTFYFPDGKLLRTHTSPVQIRAHARGQAAVRGDRAGPRVSQRLTTSRTRRCSTRSKGWWSARASPSRT